MRTTQAMRNRFVSHNSMIFLIQFHRVSTTYMGHFSLCTLYGGVLGITIAQLHNVLAAQHFCFLLFFKVFVVFVFSFYVYSDKTLLISVCGVGRISFAHPVSKYEIYTHFIKGALTQWSRRY
jgi:hypothetical protein